ncbi:MAG: thioredoxin-disulfide reductase [Candidatus Kerfeldbacteria bacterium]|nr:thioredoxin-disulfide reductase [Candidatus Kerfeldbacteria bacterium]
MYDTIIIGSGPAGYTAAIYAARANLNTLVLKGDQPGGQLTTTTVIENWPGYENGIDGNELMQKMEQQAKRFGADIEQKTVSRVNFKDQPFTVYVGEQVYQGKTIIIATGARARQTGAPGEDRLLGKGVSTCATCDGFFFKGKDVAVIGGGDTAMEEANFLTRFVNSVTIVHRRDSFRASKIMIDRTLNNPKITVQWDSTISQFNGQQHLESVTLHNLKTKQDITTPTAAVFLAIGHIPNSELFHDQIDLLPNGYIKSHGTSHTNVPGVFFAGDVEDEHYRQAVTAAAAGCRAAMDVERYLTQQ